MKKQPSCFAVDSHGNTFVLLSCIMHPMCAMADGLDLVLFPEDKKKDQWYLPVDKAIEWCRNEAKHHSKEKHEQMIKVMEKAKNQVNTTEP